MEFEVAITVLTAVVVFAFTLQYGLAAVRDAEYHAEREFQMEMDRKRWGGNADD